MQMTDLELQVDIYKMLIEWRKTKSIQLASDICKKLLYQDGKFTDEDLDEMEKEFNKYYEAKK